MGDKAIEVDCAMFGMLSQLLWNSPGSPFEQLLHGICLDFLYLWTNTLSCYSVCLISRRIQQLEKLLRAYERHLLAGLGSLSQSSSLVILILPFMSSFLKNQRKN